MGDKRNKKKKNWVGVKKQEDIMYDQPNEVSTYLSNISD